MTGLWPHPPGTLRALRTILGHHYVVCRPCRRWVDMEIPKGMEDRPFHPCPYRCRLCRQRGELVDKVPEGFARIR